MHPNRNASEEQPLTARSVVASTLLGLHPPALAPGPLVRAGEAFDIAPGTIRVALSRMLSAGELVADDGAYRLAGRLLDRLARQDASRRPELKRWDGAWRTAVVTKTSRSAAERADLRRALHELRLSELREGTWMRPDNLGDPSGRSPRAQAIADEQCLWFRANTDDPCAVATMLWDLEGWSMWAEALRRRMAASTGQLAKGSRRRELRDAFVLAASVLRHMQADPLLPAELLPEIWPGTALRADYDDYARLFGRRWGEWLGTRAGKGGA